MYKLYWSPGSAAMAPQAMLNVIGVAHELILVDDEKNEQKGAEYMRLNPHGRVPTLVYDGGKRHVRGRGDLPVSLRTASGSGAGAGTGASGSRVVPAMDGVPNQHLAGSADALLARQLFHRRRGPAGADLQEGGAALR